MATYYVSPTGSNSNNGSSGSPWQTINYAVDSGRNLQPGDTVIVRPGTYNTASSIEIKHSGSAAGGYITIKSEVKHAAKVVTTAQNGFRAVGRRYLRIEGFEVSGATGGGIAIERLKTGFADYSHHFQIIGNKVYDCGKQGICVFRSDWVFIEENEVYGCTNTDATNALICIHMQADPDDTADTTSYRMIMRRNRSHHNGLIASSTDSAGIMVDQDPNNPATDWDPDYYDYPRLIECNICHDNAGAGIILLTTSKAPFTGNPKNMNALVRNNIVYNNGLKPNAGAMVGGFTVRASAITFVNNIAVANLSAPGDSSAITVVSLPSYPIVHTGLVWRNNITYEAGTDTSIYSNTGNGSNVPVDGVNGNKLGENPLFVNAGNANFKLATGSPGIDAGTTAFGLPTVDFDGVAWTGTADIGAHVAPVEDVDPEGMSPNSTVQVFATLRSAMTGFVIADHLALGAPFTTRYSQEASPASYVADTGNTVQNSFGPVTKTAPAATGGAIVVAFSMKPA
jgi:parallel beta-helix repeat protein